MFSLYQSFCNLFIINVALLKFGYDASSKEPLTGAINIFGLGLSILGIFVCVLVEKLRRQIRLEMEKITEILQLPKVTSKYLPIKYTVIITFTFVVFCLYI